MSYEGEVLWCDYSNKTVLWSMFKWFRLSQGKRQWPLNKWNSQELSKKNPLEITARLEADWNNVRVALKHLVGSVQDLSVQFCKLLDLVLFYLLIYSPSLIWMLLKQLIFFKKVYFIYHFCAWHWEKIDRKKVHHSISTKPDVYNYTSIWRGL